MKEKISKEIKDLIDCLRAKEEALYKAEAILRAAGFGYQSEIGEFFVYKRNELLHHIEDLLEG